MVTVIETIVMIMVRKTVIMKVMTMIMIIKTVNLFTPITLWFRWLRSRKSCRRGLKSLRSRSRFGKRRLWRAAAGGGVIGF